MFKEDHLSFRQRKYMKIKNIIGRALGGIGLVVLSPVYLAIIVAIKKDVDRLFERRFPIALRLLLPHVHHWMNFRNFGISPEEIWP